MTTGTITWSLILVKVDCCRCGVVFGVPSDLDAANRADSSRWFYCPNGHRQHYSRTTEQILREQLEREERWRKAAESRATAARDQAGAAERSARAYKGQATRLRNRAAAGVCPVPECHRHFENLQRHITSQHPGFKDTDPVT